MAVSADDVVAKAREWIGTPYHHQGAVRHAGCDCLGLIRGVYVELFGPEPEAPPPYTPSWGDYSKDELMLRAASRHLQTVAKAPPGLTLADADKALVAPGHVLLFRARLGAVAKHCAIVTGPDLMVHSYAGIGVTETSIGIWSSRIAGVFAFPLQT